MPICSLLNSSLKPNLTAVHIVFMQGFTEVLQLHTWFHSQLAQQNLEWYLPEHPQQMTDSVTIQLDTATTAQWSVALALIVFAVTIACLIAFPLIPILFQQSLNSRFFFLLFQGYFYFEEGGLLESCLLWYKHKGAGTALCDNIASMVLGNAHRVAFLQDLVWCPFTDQLKDSSYEFLLIG